MGVKTLFIEPGSPWENGYIESFNGQLRDELLNREIFNALLEPQVLVERWRQESIITSGRTVCWGTDPRPRRRESHGRAAPLRHPPMTLTL